MKQYKLYKLEDISDYFGYDLTKPKQIEKLTRKTSNLIRKFPEYDTWAKIKRRGYTHCPICGKPPENAKPEVHHEPLTLFEIVFNYITELIDKNEILNYSPTEIARHILDQHLNDKIDSITICELCHKEIHNLRKVNGEIFDE